MLDPVGIEDLGSLADSLDEWYSVYRKAFSHDRMISDLMVGSAMLPGGAPGWMEGVFSAVELSRAALYHQVRLLQEQLRGQRAEGLSFGEKTDWGHHFYARFNHTLPSDLVDALWGPFHGGGSRRDSLLGIKIDERNGKRPVAFDFPDVAVRANDDAGWYSYLFTGDPRNFVVAVRSFADYTKANCDSSIFF